MVSSGPPFKVTAQSSAEDLLRRGRPFVGFPRFSICDIQKQKDQDGGDIPFSEWLTKRLQDGRPFLISDFDKLDAWPRSTSGPSFGIERLIELTTNQNLHVHNCSTGRDLAFSLRKFADSARQSLPEFQGLYARDLQCPQEWLNKCRKILPTEVQWGGSLDLFQWLPACARSEVMMAYVGSEGSNSGFHRCFSSTVALNLLVDAADDRPVVSIGTDFDSQGKYDVFMTARGASPHVDWVNLGPDELVKADFPLYVCDQRIGDLVIFPPATAHQIWNPSKLSTKLVWNILHPLSIGVGIRHVQPVFNRICHPDVARSNLSLASAMLSLMKENQSPSTSAPLPLPPDLPLLSMLFRQLIHDESIENAPPASPISLISLGKDVIATCNFCSTAIWNRHVRCTVCLDFDLCLLCYINGRSCSHAESYVWAELVLPEQCSKVLNKAREILGFQPEEPLMIEDKKTLGSVVNDLMQAKSSAATRLCHLCRIDHPEWKGRRCDECSAFFCHRGLFRHFDMNPTDVMRHRGTWVCPKCLEMCNCRCCHFSNAYQKTEKPTSKKRVRATDPRGKILGFADNVFDQKRGNRRDGSTSSSSQIVGKKRSLESDVTDVAAQVHGKVELPTSDAESSAARFFREGSDFVPTSSNPDIGFHTILPGVKTITEGSNFITSPGQELMSRPTLMLGGFSTISPSYHRPMMSGSITPLPPMVLREEHVQRPISGTTMPDWSSRTTSSFPNANAKLTTRQASPALGSSNSLPSPANSATQLGSVLDKRINTLEMKIATLKRYDEEFAALKLDDSRRALQHQLKEMESELDSIRKEKGISLIDRLKREGFDGLAEAVGKEVGLDEADNSSNG